MLTTGAEGHDLQTVKRLGAAREALLAEVHQVIVGQEQVLDEILTALFCRGHCLIEGVPGLAKTLMVRTLAAALDLEFKRIQFTPDLMPSDITGTDILEENPGTGQRRFRFLKGPLFANVVLADEINRTPPKTQAALLEAMQEYRVTVGGTVYPLPLPFFVLATQNPIEQEGTYPLPEAQLDRFMFKVLIDYPSREEERDMVKLTTVDFEPQVRPILRGEDILQLQRLVRRVPVSDHVIDYALNLVRHSRPNEEAAPDFVREWVEWGAGPRAAQYLILGAKARAVLHGRVNVSCRDVKAVAPPVLRHRIITNFNAEAEDVDSEDIIRRMLETVPEPSERDYR
ncbi:MAG TPA: MoxR family ATPase [Armatimonadetes bacterium]|nr:MoxR family ATPase [Armatimonadota bacterium]